jgi:hypothetical protein
MPNYELATQAEIEMLQDAGFYEENAAEFCDGCQQVMEFVNWLGISRCPKCRHWVGECHPDIEAVEDEYGTISDEVWSEMAATVSWMDAIWNDFVKRHAKDELDDY